MLTRASAKRASVLCDNLTSSLSERVEDEEQVIWVQCDREECQKWRKLPNTVTICCANDWYCDMHPDPCKRSCDIPEEQCDTSEKAFFTYAWFPAGQLVLAKMAGYPPWPAIVTPDPWSCGEHFSLEAEEEGSIYHVEFLGKQRSHAWIPETEITPFRRHQSSLPESKQTKSLTLAVKEAEMLSELSDKERLKLCKYKTETVSAGGLKAKAVSAGGLKAKASLKKKGKNIFGQMNANLLKAPLQEAAPSCLVEDHLDKVQTDRVPSSSIFPLHKQPLTNIPINDAHTPHVIFTLTPTLSLPANSCYNKDDYQSLWCPGLLEQQLSNYSITTKQQLSNHLITTKQLIHLASPHSKSANDQVVPSTTVEQDTCSYLEESVFKEWKEIEKLCNITNSSKTTEHNTHDLSSILNEVQHIEDLIKVINEDEESVTV